MRGLWWKALVCCSLFGCGSGDDDDGAAQPNSVTLTGTTACERAASLALALGCAPLTDCVIETACDGLAVTWLDCTAKDTRQCICEKNDGDLNCEGSFKANEGPALCSAEYHAFDDCSGD